MGFVDELIKNKKNQENGFVESVINGTYQFPEMKQKKEISTFKSLEQAGKNYELAKNKFQIQSNNLSQNVQNQGISVNKYSTSKLPTYNTLNDNRLNSWNLNKDYNTLNQVKNDQLDKNYTQIKLPTNYENLKKYSAYQQTDDFKTQEENVLKSKDEIGYAKYDYDVARINNEDVSLYDKSVGTLLRGLINFTDVGSKVRDGKGGYIELPSYNDLKQQQVQESFGNDFWGTLGKVLNSATFEIGRMGTSTIVNTIAPGAGSLTYFGSMLRDSVQGAKNEGYSGKEALIYGTLSTALEIGTEKLLGGTTKAITGGSASALNQGIANGLSRVMNNKTVINMLSHAGAEATEEFIQTFADQALRNITLGEDRSLIDKDLISEAVYSAAVGGVTGAFGSIGDNSLKITTKNERNINNSLNNAQPNILLQTNDTNLPVLNSEGNLTNPNRFRYVKTDNTKINNLRQSASKYFNNSQETQNFVRTIEKVIGDKNYNVVFDNTIKSKNGNEVNAQITTNKNGEVEIKINPNSNRAGEFLLVHEITHAIETDSMKKLVLDYANKNVEFNNALESLKQTYGATEVSSEVLADISGQLFGNQEFINSLSMEQPNVFKRIYNKIVELANKITGNSKESLFIKDLKNKWETAYRTRNNNFNGTEYHVSKNISQEIDNVLNNIKERNPVKVRDFTPQILVQNGIKDLPMYENPSHIRKNILTTQEAQKLGLSIMPNDHYHGLGKDLYIKAIDSLDQPRVIFKRNNSNNYLILTTIKDGNSNNIVVPIEIETTTNINNVKIDTNRIKTVYGYDIKNPDLNSYIKHNLNNNEFIKIYEQKKERGTGNSSVASSFLDNNITQPDNNVKLYMPSTKYSMQENQIDTTYRGEHQPDKMGVGYDLTSEGIIDESIYTNPEWYATMSEKSYRESYEVLNRVRNNPDAEVTIYRATPGNEINSGDWITLSKSYAKEHLERSLDGKGNILQKKVKAKDIQWAGDDINEFGYFPDGNQEYSISNGGVWQSWLENNYKSTGTKTNMQNIKIPTKKDIRRIENSKIDLPKSDKVLNPLEISKLTPEDANTTLPLPNVKRNTINDGESKFASNIQNKTNMLNDNQKNTILSDEEVMYYDKITNKESLEKAFEKLNSDGANATRNWFAKDSENATAIDVAEGWILLKQYADNNDADGMVATAKKMREMGTKAGQTVQAFNIMERMTPEGMVKYAQSELSEAYDRMVKGKTKKWIDQYQKSFDLTPQETGAIMEIMKKVSTMEDGYNKRVELAKIQKIMTDKLPPTKGAGIKAWMRISMLFNPKTQVRNVLGNAVIAPVNYFSDLFASAMDKVVGNKTGYRTTGIGNIQNYVKGFKEGLYQSYNDFIQGINTRNIEGNRFEIGEGKSFNDNSVIGRSLNKVDNLLSFMLDAGDRGFYEATFVNSINNQLVLNNTTEVSQSMIDIATQEALSRTWQDSNNYTKFVLQVRNGLNQINVKGYGLGDVLIPFAKTPANLTKAIVDYSPVGLVNTLIKGKNLKNAIETGQFTSKMQHDFVQSLGKATAGTMLYVAGYALAKAGIVSGESDDDKDVRDFMKNTLGVNSYSIKIGNKSFSYDWAQPIAAPLSIMANIVQNNNEDANTLEKVLSSLDTAGNILLEQSFMESINTALSNNDGLATGIEEAILDLPARAMPTFMKQIVDLTDSTQRQTFEYDKPLESMVNSVKAKIPGLSQTLAPSVDTMGREIQRYGGKNNIFNVFINPANVSTENISESANEIYRLYKETGNTNIMPRVAPYYINKDGEKITLDSNERSKYQKASGKIIETEITKLLKNNKYQKMTDDKKAEVISNIVNYSYTVAQKEVLGTELSDSYQKVYDYSKIGTVSDFYSFRESIDDTSKETKRESISNYLLNSNLSDKEIAKLYSSYYSSEETLENMMTLKIPIKEFIKLDSQEFTTDYNSNGKEITNSKKNKIINYVNSLNLSIAQKAILIKSQYSSYDSYDKQIVNYVNSQNLSKFDKATLLKSIGFDDYNSYIVKEVNSRNISAKEKAEILEDMGFRILNGRVYW